MGVAGDDGVDCWVETGVDVDDRARDVGALVHQDRVGDAALVEQHDDGLDALSLQLGHQGVGGLDLVEEVVALDAGGGHEGVGGLEGHADEADLDAVDLLDPVRGQRGGAALVDHVGRQPLEVGAGVGLIGEVAAVDRVAAAVLHAQQLGDALVELVVADAGHVEVHGVERFDRRLVVEQAAEGGGTPDEVAGGHGQAVLLAGPQLVEFGRKELGATGGYTVDGSGGVGLEMAVVVVEGQQLQLDQQTGGVGGSLGIGVVVRRRRHRGDQRHQQRECCGGENAKTSPGPGPGHPGAGGCIVTHVSPPCV